jgi:membrane protein DedA with SNARE-associated domain
MPEIDFMALITSSMIDYGPVLLGLIMLLTPFGVPVPATPIILATGAMVKTGAVEWSSFSTVLLVSVVLSDCISYLMGRYAGQKLTNHERISKRRICWPAQAAIRSNVFCCGILSVACSGF